MRACVCHFFIVSLHPKNLRRREVSLVVGGIFIILIAFIDALYLTSRNFATFGKVVKIKVAVDAYGYDTCTLLCRQVKQYVISA